MNEKITIEDGILFFPLKVFRRIEPLLKECFGFSRELIKEEIEHLVASLPLLEKDFQDSKFAKYWCSLDSDGMKSCYFDRAAFLMDTDLCLCFEAGGDETNLFRLDPKVKNERDDIEYTLLFLGLLYNRLAYAEMDRSNCTLKPDKYIIQSSIITGDNKEIVESCDFTENVRINNIHNRQQDMLKLYRFMLTSEQPITLRGKDHKAITLTCAQSWLVELLENEFIKNWGLNRNRTRQEILQEVDELLEESKRRVKDVDDKTKMPSGKDPLVNILAYGTYKLLQHHHSFASPENTPTRITDTQVECIIRYLNYLEISYCENAHDLQESLDTLLRKLQKQNFQPDLHSYTFGASPIHFSK